MVFTPFSTYLKDKDVDLILLEKTRLDHHHLLFSHRISVHHFSEYRISVNPSKPKQVSNWKEVFSTTKGKKFLIERGY